MLPLRQPYMTFGELFRVNDETIIIIKFLLKLKFLCKNSKLMPSKLQSLLTISMGYAYVPHFWHLRTEKMMTLFVDLKSRISRIFPVFLASLPSSPSYWTRLDLELCCIDIDVYVCRILRKVLRWNGRLHWTEVPHQSRKLDHFRIQRTTNKSANQQRFPTIQLSAVTEEQKNKPKVINTALASV